MKTDVEISGTCRQCGHTLIIDQESSNAPDVPEDEVFVICSVEGYPDECTAGFVKLADVI
jgi:hypothetical protein